MTSTRNRKGGDELTTGQLVLGRYRVERQIDEGGMASIYLAYDLQARQWVAIKCLYKIYSQSDVVRARFIDEGRIQMMLQHPHIVRVHQLLEQPTLAFVMEYIHGRTLEELLVERGVMETGEILEVMLPVLSALGLAHSRHIIHRDLKPSNILIERVGATWHPKVMDFGVAKLQRSDNLTATGTTVGTLHYMSPEQIVGSKKIDGRADIYSIGITLYKLCTGDVPFNAATEFALMMAQVEAPPRPPSQINRAISPEFEAVILKALAKRPEDRYQNIRDFTSALLALRDEYGKETIDTINIPSFLLDYAMAADQIAVDKTDEIVLSSKTINEIARLGQRELHERTTRHRSDAAPMISDQNDSTIELDQLKLDSFAEEDMNQQQHTLDMRLDATARARLTGDDIDRIMRSAHASLDAAETQESSVEEWNTTPLSDTIAPRGAQAGEATASRWREQLKRGRPRRPAASPPALPEQQTSLPLARHTPLYSDALAVSSRASPAPRPVMMRPRPPHDAAPEPVAPEPPSPPPLSLHESSTPEPPMSVGSPQVDTGESTHPFKMPRAQIEAAAHHHPRSPPTASAEHLAPSRPRDIPPTSPALWLALALGVAFFIAAASFALWAALR